MKIRNYTQIIIHRHSDKVQKTAVVNYCRLKTEATGHVEIGHTSAKKSNFMCQNVTISKYEKLDSFLHIRMQDSYKC